MELHAQGKITRKRSKCILSVMNERDILDERKLAALARQFRQAAGKTQGEAARELRVSRPAIVQAENNPEKSFFKLRKRIIEQYSDQLVEGPVYVLRRLPKY